MSQLMANDHNYNHVNNTQLDDKRRFKRECLLQTFVYTFLILMFAAALVTTIVSSLPMAAKLYSPTDHINVLDAKNFTAFVYSDANQNRIQLIQFYNSWCGHCIAFAPTFRKFVHNIGLWSPNLVTISVVDCAQDVNTKLCREANIYVYPTLRMLWFNAKAADYGNELKGEERTVDGLRKSVISWVIENWSKGVPRVWPDLMPVSALSKQLFMKALPLEKGIPIVIVVEKENSFIGRELILDLHSYREYVILLRMLDLSETLLNEILPKTLNHYKLPFLLTISNKDYNFEFLSMNVYSPEKIRQNYCKLIKMKFVSEEILLIEDNQKDTKDKISESDNNSHKNDVSKAHSYVSHLFMADLSNALRYSLFHEIAQKKKLNSTQTQALKNYLTVLELHFPFANENALQFVKYLNEWLTKKSTTLRNNLDMDDLVSTMKIYEEHYGLPAMKSWKGCAGTQDKYRGYPCSLWSLFHVLTVSEYKNTLLSQKWATLHSVLYAMKDYVRYFFGCTRCATHFAQMAQNLESELTHPNSSVLWLWRAHNKVNKRLNGDQSEDPNHPKLPFPLLNQCSNCYLDDDLFNESAVFEFLLKHYSADNIIKDDTETREEPNFEKHIKNNNNLIETVGSEIDTNENKKWTYSLLNGMDYSLILFLYIASACLIVTLCVVLKLKVRRRVQKGAYNPTKSINYA